MPLLTFKIQRFDPEKDKEPYMQEFTFEVEKGLTILDCLNYIKENLDATLSYRASCRMGICGSCAMLINDYPRLACETQVLVLGKTLIEIKPLPNYPLVKDLIVDLTPLFAKHRAVKPYVIHPDERQPEKEFIQTNQEQTKYLQFAYCLKCGICLAACPTVATADNFLGPQALAQAYRYNSDTRDNGLKDREKIIDSSYGLWRCHMAGACAEACPKGVDPALAIQLMKKETILGKKKNIAPLALPLVGVEPRPGIPKAPERTVK
ncbi:succinate dehydrogenase/fumarate reductase iron-sulfur subunit [Moorella sulfitireducens (nom. illeg.)]|uniref:succinate dehydrogenase/fumarate reductase iron-sulfur subunit n=1 Tax=Neomoorella sulfitireducens TaxID=2972948 RepID=UPI0021AC29BC|nr:succinate dehydrogenase iron-sulfur subunit [Moorella sulfitireducens]